MDVVVLSQPPTGVTVDIYSGFSSSITASNLGAGSGIFSSMSGTNLQFKSLVQGTGLTFTSDVNTITLTVDAAYINGLITTAITSGLNLGTPDRAVVTDGSGNLTVSSITATKIGYLTDVGSNIGALINTKQDTITGGASTIVSANLSADYALISNGSGKVAVLNTVSSTRLGYLADVTGLIQAQLDDLQSQITGITSPQFATVQVEIGPWNMTSTASVNVAHGLDKTKIRSVAGMIRDDAGVYYYPIPYSYVANAPSQRGTDELSISYISTTNVVLTRKPDDTETGQFTGTDFNDTGFSRGYLLITYEI